MRMCKNGALRGVPVGWGSGNCSCGFARQNCNCSWSEGRETAPQEELFPLKGYKPDYVDCDYAERNKVGENRFHPVFDF